MYQGNKQLRSAGEEVEYTREMIDEYIRCKEDIIYFAENYFYITSIDKGKIKIPLYDFQKKVLKAYTDPPDGKSHIITMMARQMGKTTISSVYMLHYILFNKDKTVAMLANKEKTSLEIMRRVRMAFEGLPNWLQQGIVEGGWNKSSIHLENGVRLIAATTSSDSISGETVSLLYMDEFAKVKSHVADDFITATLPVISSGKTSKVIMVSTPLGMNHFYDFWTKARRNENDFFPVKVPWWEHPDRDEEWKERTLRLLNGDEARFNQEYGCRFLGSTSTLIDPDVLERIEYKDPLTYKWNGVFKIFEKPEPNTLYILGIDTAKGTGRDYSVVQVLKIDGEKKIKQVAVYRNNKIDTHEFAQVCISISDYYNNAHMMIENNAEGGETANVIWYEYENENILNCDAKGIGIRSTKKSKLAANLLIKRYIEAGWLELLDKDTVMELSRYIEVSGLSQIFRAETRTTHDDCVTALLWGMYFITTEFFDGKDLEVKNIDEKYNIDDDDGGPMIFYDGE